MHGVKPVPVEPLKNVVIDPSRIRGVSWLPSPSWQPPPKPPDVPEPPRANLPEPAVEPALAGFSEPVRLEPPAPAWNNSQEERLRAAIEVLKAQGERLAEQARSDALELGLLIARRILERELSSNLESVFALIKSAIRRAGAEHVTRVRLSPGDIARFDQAAQPTFSLGRIELVADTSLQPGDVMVDTDTHTIDGRLATRFEEVARQLDGMTP